MMVGGGSVHHALTLLEDDSGDLLDAVAVSSPVSWPARSLPSTPVTATRNVRFFDSGPYCTVSGLARIQVL